MNPKGTFASVVIVMSIEGMKVVDPLSGEVLSTTPIKGISYEYYALLCWSVITCCFRGVDEFDKLYLLFDRITLRDDVCVAHLVCG